MAVAALLKFVQGALVGTAGVALIGLAGADVVASNNDNTNVVRWVYTTIDVPPGSAVPVGVNQDGATTTYTFHPDVRGGYHIVLDVYDSGNVNHSQHHLVFQIKELSGRIIVPFSAESPALNFSSQVRGWAVYAERYLRMIDGIAPTNVTTTGAIENRSSVDANSEAIRAFRFSGAAPALGGLDNGYEGREVTLHADGGNLTIVANSGGSLAANQFSNATVVSQGTHIRAIYSNAKWRIASGGSGAGTGVRGDVYASRDNGSGIVAQWERRALTVKRDNTTGALNNFSTLDANSNPLSALGFGRTGNVTLSSLNNPWDGREIVIYSDFDAPAEGGGGGGGTVTLLSDDGATGTAANRFYFPEGDIVLMHNDSIRLIYWLPLLRWVPAQRLKDLALTFVDGGFNTLIKQDLGGVGMPTGGISAAIVGYNSGVPYQVPFPVGEIIINENSTQSMFNKEFDSTSNVSAAFGGQLPDSSQNGWRLSLTTGVPVTTTDVTAAGTLYFMPYLSDMLWLFDTGLSRWVSFLDVQSSLTLTGLMTSGKLYDVFAYYSAGIKIELSAAWTNDTTRADALTTIGGPAGVQVKSSDHSRRRVGTIRATGTGTTEDSAAKRFVQNGPEPWRKVRRECRNATETANSWSYTTTSFRQANANAANQVEFVNGDDMYVEAEVMAFVSGDAAGRACSAGIGDGNATNIAQKFGFVTPVATQPCPMFATFKGRLAVGYHALQWLELGATTTTFYGDNNTPTTLQSGMAATIWM